MLIYNGYLKFDTPLSQEECDLLNQWQTALSESSQAYKKDKENEGAFWPIEKILKVSLTPAQKWTMHFCSNPLISFDKEGIKIEGESEKGQLREALLAYNHFFLKEEPVLTHCDRSLTILKPHTFSGIIKSEKDTYKGNTRWCYIVENSDISSVDARTPEEYLANPQHYPVQNKIDTCLQNLDKYFPPLYLYLKLKKMSHALDEAPVAKKNKI